MSGSSTRAPFAFCNFSDVLESADHPLHPSTDFDWDSLRLDAEQREEVERMANEIARRMTMQAVRRLASWVIEESKVTLEGAGLRAYVVAWSVLPSMQELTQTQLAKLVGRSHKQSVGRVVTSYRDFFGWICNHMQSTQARRSAQLREQRKRENGSPTTPTTQPD